MAGKPTQKREYATPELLELGTVKELTEQVPAKCIGSADATLPREFPTEGDFACGLD